MTTKPPKLFRLTFYDKLFFNAEAEHLSFSSYYDVKLKITFSLKYDKEQLLLHLEFLRWNEARRVFEMQAVMFGSEDNF